MSAIGGRSCGSVVTNSALAAKGRFSRPRSIPAQPVARGGHRSDHGAHKSRRRTQLPAGDHPSTRTAPARRSTRNKATAPRSAASAGSDQPAGSVRMRMEPRRVMQMVQSCASSSLAITAVSRIRSAFRMSPSTQLSSAGGAWIPVVLGLLLSRQRGHDLLEYTPASREWLVFRRWHLPWPGRHCRRPAPKGGRHRWSATV